MIIELKIMECACCFCDIDDVLKYRDEKDGKWKDCIYCKDCVEYMIETQFNDYVERIKNETCKVSLERLLEMGPPLKFRDPKVICNNDKNEVYEFNMFQSDLNNVYKGDKMVKYMNFIENYLNEIKNNN